MSSSSTCPWCGRSPATRASGRSSRTTIDLAHQLGVKVVAEGVESEAVRSELQALGCDIGQGFLLGRPMAADGLRATGCASGNRSRRAGALPGHRRRRRRCRAATANRGPRAGPPETGGCAAPPRPEPGGRPTLAAAVAMMAVYGLWQVFRWGGHQHQALIGDLAFFPVNGAAAVCAWRVSRRKDLGRGHRAGPGGCSPSRSGSTCSATRIQLLYEVVLHKQARSELGRRRLPELLPGRLRRPARLPGSPPDGTGAAPAAARRGDGLHRRSDAHLVRGARAGRGVAARLRPARPGDLRLPGRRPAALVRRAVAAVAGRPPARASRRCGSSPPACSCSSRPTSPTTTSPSTRPISAATRSTRYGCWR